MEHDPIARARQHLAEGDATGALRALRPAIDYPADAEEKARLVSALELLTEILRALGSEPLADRIAAVVAAPDDARALYDAAYSLYEQQAYAVAATLLSRANRLVPGAPEIVTELSANLEAMMAYGPAMLTVEASGLVGSDPMCTYLHGFMAMMTGQVEVARGRADDLARFEGAQTRGLRDALVGMVARADAVHRAVPLHDRQLTGWHAVIQGTVLLHESPFGFDEGMNGRYAFISDSPGLMREGLMRMQAVLAAAGRTLSRVVAAPDRASRVLSRAAAALLGLPLEPWSPGRGASGLVVVWDLDAVGDGAFLGALRQHTSDQLLFAHASSWVNPFPFAPDVTTFLYQHVTHPWTGGALCVDPETQQAVRAEPDLRSEEALAQEILDAGVADPSHGPLAEVLDVTRALAVPAPEHRGGIYRTSGHRLRQRAGSPVPSSRFS